MPVEKLKSLPKVNVFVRGQCKIVQSVFTFFYILTASLANYFF